MSLRFVADEHLHGPLVSAVADHNQASGSPIDLTAVGDPPDLPRGSADSDILRWAEREGRLVVSRDANTMPGHLAAHLAAGESSPGVLLLRDGFSLAEVVEFLELVTYACDPTEFADLVTFFP